MPPAEASDRIDLAFGLSNDRVVEEQTAVLLCPAVVTALDTGLVVEKALALAAGMVRDVIDGRYEQPERFAVSFPGTVGGREGETPSVRGRR